MPDELLWKKKKADGYSNSTSTPILIAQTSVQFILEHLDLLLFHDSLKENLETLMYFLERVEETWIQHPAISDLVLEISKVMEVLLASVYSYLKSTTISAAAATNNFLQHGSEVASLVRKIVEIEAIVEVVGGECSNEISLKQKRKNQIENCLILEENLVVGFDCEISELMDKLIGGRRKRLEVISLIGMAGIGKTALAKRLYNDPQIRYYFHVRAWISVSEFYEKRNLLNDLLSFTVQDGGDSFILNMSDIEMGDKLYKSLKGRKYFILIDDLWSPFAWYDLKAFLPEDNNGSRILMTSRYNNVALQIRPGIAPILLRFLSQDESWDLFKRKIFPDSIVPEELVEVGKAIVEKCKGLPRAIVSMAGILAKEEEKTEKRWREFEKNIRSSNSNESLEYMDFLELSYKHLPKPLQCCFLYLGTFPKDNEISVKRLIWSWIGEGFIEHIPGKRLEDVAEDWLMDLINGSLVIVVKKNTNGRIKSCQIHDLLRDLCVLKAKEKRFLQPICNCHTRKDSFYSEPESDINDPFYTCDKHLHVYYGSHYVSTEEVFTEKAISLFKFLRRLELGITFVNFPEQIFQLLHLRYLALKFKCINHPFPSSIFDPWNLETCIFDVEKGGTTVELPQNIWKMVNLRHLHISQEVILNGPMEGSSTNVILANLQTISQLCPLASITPVLARTPNLRSLGFHMILSKIPKPFCFPYIAHLSRLENLKFEYQTLGLVRFSIPELYTFPPSLKKLTLVGSYVQWEGMSIIALLPNLEILKIKDNFFSGPLWETSDNGFHRLKFLKLSHMDLRKWISSSDHFPRLEHLVLNGCLELEEVPFELGDIPTLQSIKVYLSSNSTMISTQQILEFQKSMGNDDLEVFLYHHLEEFSNAK